MEQPAMSTGDTIQRRTGERVELARYTISSGQRVIYGQRVNGVVRLTDVPADAHGRSLLIERELEQDGNGALQAVVTDYVAQATRHDQIPLLRTSL
jgi:hypothetical protein